MSKTQLHPCKRRHRLISCGQSLAEYALVLALVAVVAMGSLNLLGNSIKNQLSSLGISIAQASGSSGGGGGITAPPSATPSLTPTPALPNTFTQITSPSTGSTAQGGCSGNPASGCLGGGTGKW